MTDNPVTDDPVTPFYSYEDLVLIAKQQVEKMGPDYVYPYSAAKFDEDNPSPADCRYFDIEREWQEGKIQNIQVAPSCIVGHMLMETTPDILNLVEQEIREDEEYYSDPAWNETGVGEILHSQRLLATETRGKMLLSLLQSKQDRGTPWGTALTEAQNEISEAIGDNDKWQSLLIRVTDHYCENEDPTVGCEECRPF